MEWSISVRQYRVADPNPSEDTGIILPPYTVLTTASHFTPRSELQRPDAANAEGLVAATGAAI